MKFLPAICLLSASTLLFACGGASSTQEPAASPEATTEAAPTANIVKTASAAGSFSTLVAAVQAAGLVETLSGPGPFTVFAPTDDAFAKLPAGTVDDLLKPENKEKLVAILTYHVVAGKMTAAEVVAQTKLLSLQGQELSVSMEGDAAKLDGATIVKTDILASNGVIHVIDSVVIPK